MRGLCSLLLLASLAWSFSAFGATCSSTQPSVIVDDCSFEASVEGQDNSNAFWTSSTDDIGETVYCNADYCGSNYQHSGSWWLQFQPFTNTVKSNYTMTVSQSVTIPNGAAAQLSFWLDVPACRAAGDVFTVKIDTTNVYSTGCSVAGYRQVLVDISAFKNGTHTLKFVAAYATTPAGGFTTTIFAVDDVDITVGKEATTTQLTADPAAPTVADAITLTATVSDGASATGTVQFKNGTTVITGCSAVALDTTTHTAVCNSPALAAGAHTLHAVYSGDTLNATSSGTLSLSVAKVASTTTLGSACMTTFVQGQPFTLDVAESGLSPIGNVAFKDGAANLAGCGAVALSAGTASCTSSALGIGTHMLTAAYAGDAKNQASTSGTITVLVLDPQDVVFRNDFEAVLDSCPVE